MELSAFIEPHPANYVEEENPSAVYLCETTVLIRGSFPGHIDVFVRRFGRIAKK